MVEDPEEITVFECPKCWAIIPYLGCPHRCPGDWSGNDEEEEGFCEDRFLEKFLEEIKGMRVTVVEADDPEILEMIPNQPGQVYEQNLCKDGDEQAYHIRQEGEVIPEGVEIIRVMKIGPGEYKREDEIIREAEEIYGPLSRQ